jgi:hypothetical protein
MAHHAKPLRVASSAIASVRYDPATQILEVEFHSGRVYQYFDVAAEELDALRQADSIGAYFNREIKPRHRVREITEPRRRR